HIVNHIRKHSNINVCTHTHTHTQIKLYFMFFPFAVHDYLLPPFKVKRRTRILLPRYIYCPLAVTFSLSSIPSLSLPCSPSLLVSLSLSPSLSTSLSLFYCHTL